MLFQAVLEGNSMQSVRIACMGELQDSSYEPRPSLCLALWNSIFASMFTPSVKSNWREFDSAAVAS